MKKAILYTRVSTDEQAEKGFSLRDQESRLRDYCTRHGIKVVAHYQDDASAKTFERPAWKQLIASVRNKRGVADQVLFVKWDRFSRNMADAIQMIQTLDRLGLEAQAIEQPIDRSIPEQLMMLAIYLAAPEVENERRSLNVIYGMRRAGREGRTTGAAPYGYQNVRDELHRSTMVPDENAPLVREAFELAAYSNDSLESIRRHLRGKGMTLSSTRFHLMLRTPAYIGKNRLAPWRDEPGELVDALHEAIVDEAVFHEVQRRRFSAAEDRRVYRKFNPDLPLRRHIVCPNCGGRLTGGAARGRHGGKYPYYWCHHCDLAKREDRVRFRAQAVETAVEGYFESLRIEAEVGVLYREILQSMTKGDSEHRRRRQGIIRRQLNEVEQKLLRADEMFLDSKLDAESYGRLKRKLAEDRTRLQAELESLDRAGGDDLAKKIDIAVEVLLNPSNLLKTLSPRLKSDFVGVMAPAGLVYDGEELLNPDPDGLIALFSPRTALFGGDGAEAARRFPSGGPGGI